MLIEGWSLSDALFMAATTITTVGYGEVHPLSERGRIFTILLLLVGLMALWYALSVLVSVALEGELGLQWEERRMERQMRQIRDHYIVAGFGRVGRETSLALRDLDHQVVVIDQDPASARAATEAGMLAIEGNATDDAILARAQVDRAAGLLAALGDDADNVFVILSARALHPALPIVARANTTSAIPKLTRAGAGHVVSPYESAGWRMARLAVRPRTVDFIESLFRGPSGALILEDVHLDARSPLVGMTILEAQAQVPHAVFIAIQRNGATFAPPAPETRLAAGDAIAVVGTEANLRRLEEISQSPARPSGSGET